MPNAVVAIGAMNGQQSTVLSGDYAAVAKVVKELQAKAKEMGKDVPKAKKVKGCAHADHSVRMGPAAEALTSAEYLNWPLVSERHRLRLDEVHSKLVLSQPLSWKYHGDRCARAC